MPILGLGYQQGFRGDGIGHLVLGLGASLVLRGQYTGLIPRDGFPKVIGNDTRMGLLAQVAVPVTRQATPTQLVLATQVRQTFAFGRHALLLVGSAGGRFDTVDRKGGLELTLGLGYALVLPPSVLPITVQLVYETFGIYDRPAAGVRITLGT